MPPIGRSCNRNEVPCELPTQLHDKDHVQIAKAVPGRGAEVFVITQLSPQLSAGQLCDLRTRPVHVASRTAVYGFCTISDDATALR